ncbi:unnamed protein product [Fraxinus pennsylvanica]|uniref:CTLH domain-containing protein n=1 Tax=Fraxinus pennsylvanica TaxID=56036 RepID=A0AAD1Z8I5_9LAMI|nr:unnamed protein product [Fraxinus pennsylvanica]
MESIAVNWEALDALVTDFAKSEQLIEDAQSPLLSPSTTTFASRLLIRQIRRLLESGEIDSAINLLRVHAPSVLDDHRLLFRLQKQERSDAIQFVEVKEAHDTHEYPVHGQSY